MYSVTINFEGRIGDKTNVGCKKVFQEDSEAFLGSLQILKLNNKSLSVKVDTFNWDEFLLSLFPYSNVSFANQHAFSFLSGGSKRV